MSYDVGRYFGFYFEINKQETYYKNEYRCKNGHQFGTNVGYSFCPLCAETVECVEYENGSSYISHMKIEELCGFSEELILPSGEVSKENKKYHGLNCRYEGVRKDSLDDDAIFIDFSSVDYNGDLQKAMQNKDFAYIVKTLEDTFGENFKLKYGIFTYIL